ncbi:G2/mitotic-specific cyclin-B3 [Dermacentor silvarum]|uniref:G2/mitotic-specific cyclin-B3 n=1 Tax=Dermacentor silvarum TaxID=543639 RepID=UPI00189B9C75|nr:G2/mitotic-specific cyclin-B3 [Dermacentor silvarum]
MKCPYDEHASFLDTSCAIATDLHFKGAQALVSQKRAAENSPQKAPSRKRAILGDITNPNHKAIVTAAAAAAKKGGLIKPGPKKTVLRARNVAVAAAAAAHKPVAKAATAATVATKPLPEKPTSSEEPQTSALPIASEERQRSDLPEGVADFDFESQDEPFSESTYASDIFNYYKEREESFVVPKYRDRQMELSVSMRAVLVDWMWRCKRTLSSITRHSTWRSNVSTDTCPWSPALRPSCSCWEPPPCLCPASLTTLPTA